MIDNERAGETTGIGNFSVLINCLKVWEVWLQNTILLIIHYTENAEAYDAMVRVPTNHPPGFGS